MIDDPLKTRRLLADLGALLPIEARPTPGLAETLSKQSSGWVVPARCNVVSIHYAGEAGGIVCGLDIVGPESSKPFVSITHLDFDRRSPLFRQIAAYQRHRIKKLKRQAERP
jgi:hypothetical protein